LCALRRGARRRSSDSAELDARARTPGAPTVEIEVEAEVARSVGRSRGRSSVSEGRKTPETTRAPWRVEIKKRWITR